MAPAIVRAATFRHKGHKASWRGTDDTIDLLKQTNSTRGSRGRSGITAKKVRLRQGEMCAISVKPRGWQGRVSAWVVKGTKPHLISPHGSGEEVHGAIETAAARAGTSFTAMRGAVQSGAAALFVNGAPYALVHHPGGKPNPYVARAAHETGLAEKICGQLARDLSLDTSRR